ncbi:MAG: hypothetical protein ACR2IH_09745 [Pyrinomonadaceae bacterium]
MLSKLHDLVKDALGYGDLVAVFFRQTVDDPFPQASTSETTLLS